MTTERLRQLDKQHMWHPFTPMKLWIDDDPLVIVAAEGMHLIDSDGKRYLDGVSSLWCNVHGHRRRELDQAIQAQLGKIAHSTFLGLAHVPGIELAEKLIRIAPSGLQRVFYSDDGATAVEAALKIAVQYWQLNSEGRRTKIASLAEAYHGDTVGSMSVGYAETFHRFHRSLLFPVLRLNPPHVFRYYERMSEDEALRAAIQEAETKLGNEKESLAALIVEPLMQGAAGMWVHPVAYLQALREICRKERILFIADEVATGFGRTGKMFACEHAGAAPDILCVAKGITGGYLPLAATLATEEIFAAFLGEYKEFKTFFHGHTYTGNPLGCAAALASLKLFESENILDRMRPKIDYIRARLAREFLSLDHVADIRQWGFMVGVELAEDKRARRSYPVEKRIGHQVILEARRRGVIIRPLGDVVILKIGRAHV